MTHPTHSPELVEAVGPWTCFHCNETFTNPCCAELHFGSNETQDPACKIKAGSELHLVEHIRDLEAQLQDYRNDTNRILVAWEAKHADHQAALRKAEEDGYNKGLRDGRALTAAEPFIAARVEAAVEAEREECAKVMDRRFGEARPGLDTAASAIRARGGVKS